MVGYLPRSASAKGAGAGPRRPRGCRAHSTAGCGVAVIRGPAGWSRV